MTVKVGINGFGRIGRLAARAMLGVPSLQLAHVNEPMASSSTSAHLLEFDSVHGRFDATISADESALFIEELAGHEPIVYTTHDMPGDVVWGASGVDVVLECSGRFRTLESLTPHLDRGARKVVVSAPVNDRRALNVVMGCNDHLYRDEVHNVVTAASCTTNCLAPVVKVLQESIGIERGVVTTIHDVTNTQVVVDTAHADLRRARSALNSLIPTSTGSATAIGMIFPELVGKLNGVAVRVPLLNASLVDAVFTMDRPVDREEVNQLFKTAAAGSLAGILGYEERPLVSADFVNDTRSAIVDGPSTMVVDGHMVKVLAWYDNEVGYAHRMVDLAVTVAESLAVESSPPKCSSGESSHRSSL